MCIGVNKIVIGMRSGTIHEVPISDDGSAMVRPNVDKKTKIRTWIKCIDHEITISVAVDMVSQRIFTITHAGLFSVWDIETFDIIYQRDFEEVSIDIIAFKLSNKVLIVFENFIQVLDSNVNGGYDILDEFTLRLS